MAKVEKSERFVASRKGLVDALRVEGYDTMRVQMDESKVAIETAEPEFLEFNCPFSGTVSGYGNTSS